MSFNKMKIIKEDQILEMVFENFALIPKKCKQFLKSVFRFGFRRSKNYIVPNLIEICRKTKFLAISPPSPPPPPGSGEGALFGI